MPSASKTKSALTNARRQIIILLQIVRHHHLKLSVTTENAMAGRLKRRGVNERSDTITPMFQNRCHQREKDEDDEEKEKLI